jgi:hypothetical protein
VLEKEMAICTPETIDPTKRPHTAYTPKNNPVNRGDPITKSPGKIIFLREALVLMSMHLS